MIIPADLPLPPVSPLDDVPIQRDVIGGAGAPTMGSQYPSNEGLFRRYVYRGTGKDIYETPPPPRAKPKRDPAKIREANIKRARKYGQTSTRVKYPRKPKPRFDTRPRYHYAPEPKPPEPPPEPALPTAEDWETDFADMPTGDAPEHWRVKRHSDKPRASAGWKPASGDDIDNWLTEMEE